MQCVNRGRLQRSNILLEAAFLHLCVCGLRYTVSRQFGAGSHHDCVKKHFILVRFQVDACWQYIRSNIDLMS